MPQKAPFGTSSGGQQRGRPQCHWDWIERPLPPDDDWWFLLLLLMCIPNYAPYYAKQKQWLRPLIREVRAARLYGVRTAFPDRANPVVFDPSIANEHNVVNRIEIKFWSLVEYAVERLEDKHLGTTDEEVIKEATHILKKCILFSDLTAKEHRILREGAKVWNKLIDREKSMRSIPDRLF
jgi:hypothetical protein